jgi:hypothetical protein
MDEKEIGAALQRMMEQVRTRMAIDHEARSRGWEEAQAIAGHAAKRGVLAARTDQNAVAMVLSGCRFDTGIAVSCASEIDQEFAEQIITVMIPQAARQWNAPFKHRLIGAARLLFPALLERDLGKRAKQHEKTRPVAVQIKRGQ